MSTPTAEQAGQMITIGGQIVALGNQILAALVTIPPAIVPPPVVTPPIQPAGSIFGALGTTAPVGKTMRGPAPGIVGYSGITFDSRFWYGDAMRLNVSADTVLYFRDDGHRSQLVEAIDPVTRKVLETATVANFMGGVYLPVTVARPMELRITTVPVGSNALLAGIFT